MPSVTRPRSRGRGRFRRPWSWAPNDPHPLTGPFTIDATLTDDYGNPISGEVITYTPSNGTMTGSTFAPYTSGARTIEVAWAR
ncbi:MAG: hypothetical protein CM15mP79_2080 [Methanobacteriota archaeon]|nr:MAG: hypothetical protein CM15mP79_2080 [Euryarchaeota archaeon]